MTLQNGTIAVLQVRLPANISDPSKGCTDLSSGGLIPIFSCLRMEIELPQESLTEPYTPAFTVDVPNQQACTVNFGGAANLLTVLPAPREDVMDQFGVCAGTGQPATSVVVTGDHFYTYDGTLPTVVVETCAHTPMHTHILTLSHTTHTRSGGTPNGQQ
jgi:hypothetical protein